MKNPPASLPPAHQHVHVLCTIVFACRFWHWRWTLKRGQHQVRACGFYAAPPLLHPPATHTCSGVRSASLFFDGVEGLLQWVVVVSRVGMSETKWGCGTMGVRGGEDGLCQLCLRLWETQRNCHPMGDNQYDLWGTGGGAPSLYGITLHTRGRWAPLAVWFWRTRPRPDPLTIFPRAGASQPAPARRHKVDIW